MSNTYRRICLSHQPPLVIDENYQGGPAGDDGPAPTRPPGHPECTIGVGRWSGGLVAIWLPHTIVPRGRPHETYEGRWYDVGWLHRYPGLADNIISSRYAWAACVTDGDSRRMS